MNGRSILFLNEKMAIPAPLVVWITQMTEAESNELREGMPEAEVVTLYEDMEIDVEHADCCVCHKSFNDPIPADDVDDPELWTTRALCVLQDRVFCSECLTPERMANPGQFEHAECARCFGHDETQRTVLWANNAFCDGCLRTCTKCNRRTIYPCKPQTVGAPIVCHRRACRPPKPAARLETE
jgi:hypothetical protein